MSNYYDPDREVRREINRLTRHAVFMSAYRFGVPQYDYLSAILIQGLRVIDPEAVAYFKLDPHDYDHRTPDLKKAFEKESEKVG